MRKGYSVILRRLLFQSWFASAIEVFFIIAFLIFSTDLTVFHFLKALPSLVFLSLLVMILEWYFARKWLSRTREFYEVFESKSSEEELGEKALLSQEELSHFSIRFGLLVFGLWFFCGLFLFASLLLPWGATFYLWETTFVLLLSILGGLIASVFQFYAFKRILRETSLDLIEWETGYHLNQGADRYFNLARKLRYSILPLLFGGLALLLAMGFTQSSILLRDSYLSRLLSARQWLEEGGLTREEFQARIEQLQNILGMELFLTKGAGTPYWGSRSIDIPKSVLDQVDKANRERAVWFRYNPQMGLAVTQISLDGGTEKVYLGMVFDWRKVSPLSRKMFGLMFTVAVLVFVLGLYVLRLISEDITFPIFKMVEQAEEVSKGNLAVNFNIFSDDEVGVLGARVKGMVHNLRDLMERIQLAHHQLEGVIEEILKSSEEVALGTREQMKSVEDTSFSISQMNQAIKEVSNKLELLKGTSTDTIRRSDELMKLMEEVELKIDELARSEELSANSIFEMGASIKQVASNIELLMNRSEETSSSVLEMEASIRQVEESAKESKRIGEQVRLSAREGVEAVNKTIQGIGVIEETVSRAMEVIEELGKSSEQVGKILKVIQDVANQTNLLALNAAIIAASAGEYGKGFAVVADEIKNLADRVASSTREIDQIIKGFQAQSAQVIEVMRQGYSQVEAGVNLSYQAGEALERIEKSVEESFRRAEQITSVTADQVEATRRAAKAISEIAELVGQIVVSTKEQTKGAEQVSHASEEIAKISKSVRDRISQQIISARQVKDAMEQVEGMVRYIHEAQLVQAQGGEKIVDAIELVKRTAFSNVKSVEIMDKSVGILKQQSEVLSNIFSRFRSYAKGDEGL